MKHKTIGGEVQTIGYVFHSFPAGQKKTGQKKQEMKHTQPHFGTYPEKSHNPPPERKTVFT
ncbi:MAG: hypothetical protein K1X92_08230 [Bacteroidia bacterium]|nr:hypothetical protein [Bacteroidia bacterium]